VARVGLGSALGLNCELGLSTPEHSILDLNALAVEFWPNRLNTKLILNNYKLLLQ